MAKAKSQAKKKPVAKKKTPAKAKAVPSKSKSKTTSAKTAAKVSIKPANKSGLKSKSSSKPKQKSKVTSKTPKASSVKPAPKASAGSSAKMKLVDLSQFVTPLDDRLVVQLTAAERMTPGGLIIPDTVTDVAGHKEGVVVAVGRGHRDPKGRLRPMDVRQGDKVVFSSFAGSKLEYQNADLVILRETDVMGVVS